MTIIGVLAIVLCALGLSFLLCYVAYLRHIALSDWPNPPKPEVWP